MSNEPHGSIAHLLRSSQ